MKRLSPARVTPVLLEVTAPARSKGIVRAAGLGSVPFTIADDETVATVSLDLGEGTHPPAQVGLTDAVGRTTAVSSPVLLVDTVAPPLKVQVDTAKAGHGRLDLAIVSEPGSRVRVNAVRGERTFEEGFEATATVRTLDRELEAGDYRVTVIATDEVGNSTTWTRMVHVAVPLTTVDWIVLVVLLLGIAGLARFAWRRRARVAQWLERRQEVARERALQRRQAAAQAAHARAMAEFGEALAAYEQASAAWVARRTTLQQLSALATAAPDETLPSSVGFKMRRGEKVFTVFQGSMVEERSRQGDTALVPVGRGTVVVSDQRIAFAGDKSREWVFDTLTDKTHMGSDITLLTVTNRKTRSGIQYPVAGERTRVLIDAAIEEATTGGRVRTVERLRRVMAEHDRLRPIQPAPPTAPALVEAASVWSGSAVGTGPG